MFYKTTTNDQAQMLFFSNLRTVFDKLVGRMGDMGLIQHLLSKEMPPSIVGIANSRDKGENDLDLRPLPLTSFLGAFILLSLGLGLATLVLVTKEASKTRRRALN